MASKSSFDFSGISSNFKLSEREQEVITLLLKGKSYQDIGETLFLSKATIKTYVLRIYQKAGVNSKMELVNKIMASKGKQ